MIDLLEFHIALSEVLFTACVYQLIYNLSLIKLSSTCAKQTAGVNASDLVEQRASSLITKLEQVIKSFVV